MAFNLRNLLNESPVDEDTFRFCQQCYVRTPPGATCQPECKNRCPDFCGNRSPEIIPQPPVPTTPVVTGPPGKPHRLSPVLIVSLSVLATAFLLFTCYTIYKFYSQSRRRSLQRRRQDEESGPEDFLDEDHGPFVDHPIWYIRTVGLQPSVISAITIVKYKKGEGLIEGTDCSVCLNEFQEDETLRLLPKCNHAFHIPCIDTWLRSHTNCPMCRAGIVNSAGVLELDFQDSGLVEEARAGSNREVRRESESEGSELTIGVEDDGESEAEIGLKINENLGDPLRRSVSLDSLSASMISAAIANGFQGQRERNSDNQAVEAKDPAIGVIAKRIVSDQSPSIERLSQSGPSSMKRSLSCTAKVFLSRNGSRNRN
ncbi:Anaphase-promoting complex (APC), subunit 11 [Handroanthus impetiginosus]|uniref:RING-type E3 ubiquitin transferase n=1 Tax=Handroanthus impetiginosus TaxID=429701 RepID=A0A2G9G556_9LAMI|nr:Anaphase-promoting complex (APC), subunit 11 [Handroanthus impetiginosus]